MEDTVMSVKQS